MSGIAPLIQQANCKLWLPCQEASSGITLDRSGNGNNGTVLNPQIIDGKTGKCFRIDQIYTNKCVTISNPSNFDFIKQDTSFTLACWARIDKSISSTVRFLVIKVDSDAIPQIGMRIYNSGTPYINRFNFTFIGSGTDYASIFDNRLAYGGTNELPDKTWMYFTVVKSGSTYAPANLKMYINGIEITARTELASGTYSVQIPTHNVYVGSAAIGGGYTNGVEISHVGIWNIGLSAKEISVLYNSTKGSFLI